MEASCVGGYQFAQPCNGNNNAGGCVLIVLLVLFVVACIWMCVAQGGKKKLVMGDAIGRDLRCGIPESEAARPTMSPEELRKHATETFVRAPVPNASSGINNSIGMVPFTPNLGSPTSDEMIGSRAMAGGTPYQAGAFAPSDTSAEFFATFQPSSLSSMMPANWRPSGQNCGAVAPAQAGASPVDANFDEFSRYTVAPSQVQRAETLRGTIRLAELTSTRNARTLGESSLLRNAVTPLSPIPIGSNAFVFSDSQARQGFIAAATGRYPDEIGC
jgi:hypothetical protein